MAEVSLKLHSCLNAMKVLSQQKKEDIMQSNSKIASLNSEYEKLKTTIETTEQYVNSTTLELSNLNEQISQTQATYKQILDSTRNLMQQVKQYNPETEHAESQINRTLDEIKQSDSNIQMTDKIIATEKANAIEIVGAENIKSVETVTTEPDDTFTSKLNKLNQFKKNSTDKPKIQSVTFSEEVLNDEQH
jgi:chromosome segregation ATPase